MVRIASGVFVSKLQLFCVMVEECRKIMGPPIMSTRVSDPGSLYVQKKRNPVNIKHYSDSKKQFESFLERIRFQKRARLQVVFVNLCVRTKL
jgi:hypothetical protein